MGLLGSIGKFMWNSSPVGMAWNALSGIWKSGADVVKEGVNTVKDVTSSIKNSIAGATTPSKIYDGGFAGMNESAIEDVKANIKKYVQEMQASVNSFDDGKEIDTFLKGETNAAAREYVKSVKELMSTYLTGLDQVASGLDSAYAQFQESAKAIATTTMSDADALRSKATGKNLD